MKCPSPYIDADNEKRSWLCAIIVRSKSPEDLANSSKIGNEQKMNPSEKEKLLQ